MAEHKYAQVLIWIAEGRKVQVDIEDFSGNKPEWVDRSSSDVLKYIADGIIDLDRLRLAPIAVKIGNREVEAPVLNPAKGQKVYAVWPDGFNTEWEFRPGGSQHEAMAAAGFFYSTQDAANAAREAIISLLTGKE